MRPSISAAVFSALTATCLSSVTLGDVVERRGQATALEGDVLSTNDEGVTVRTATGALHMVPWDRVRSVDTGQPPDPLLERRLERAQLLWRARSRVERDDTTLAEPLLERLFAEYRGQTHETALVVAEGLLRCRLARGEHALAVIPSLEVARLRRAGIETDSYRMLRAVHDETTALCPALPPVWAPSPLLDSLTRDLKQYQAADDPVVSAIARLYSRAIGAQSDDDPDTTTQENHPGVTLLSWLIDGRSTDAATRRGARGHLQAQLDRHPTWAQAWMRYHLGLSLLLEEGIGRQQQGLVQLAHLPANFGRTQPYLAGMALDRLAGELATRGQTEAARSVRTELTRRYPNHPVRQTPSTGSG